METFLVVTTGTGGLLAIIEVGDAKYHITHRKVPHKKKNYLLQTMNSSIVGKNPYVDKIFKEVIVVN